MKLDLKGFEIIKGDSQKTGKPYDMTRIHVDIPLAESATARGKAGTTYDCPAEVLAPILNIKLPAMCEVEIQDVMQWGKRVQRISSIAPINAPAPRATA